MPEVAATATSASSGHSAIPPSDPSLVERSMSVGLRVTLI